MNASTAADSGKQRTLLVSRDVIGDKMAGPGIRYFHLSRILGQHTDLTLAVLRQNEQSLASLQAKLPHVSVIEYKREQWHTIRDAAEAADTIILSPYLAAEFPQLATLSSAVVIDGYDPLLVEWLTTLPENDLAQQSAHWRYRMIELFSQFLMGDFFICASERQRHWWLGKLEVAGRINPTTFQTDPSLRSLVDVVPYGLPEEPARHHKQIIKGVWPGIEPDDIVLLWGGGLWSWLDPLTAVRAVARLHSENSRFKLIFPGTRHPNPEMQAMPVHTNDVHALAQETGLLDKAIFFGEWVPYDDWPNVLLESDIALSLHHDTVETQLAFRSRILEYIWAGVPIVATRGDTTSDLVARYGLGEVVDYESADEVVQAVLRLTDDGAPNYQRGLATARQELKWECTAKQLVRFCQAPRRAADRREQTSSGVPYYEQPMQQMKQENQRLQALVQGYERGKIMRLLKRLHGWRRRLLSTNGS
ncbi:MAG: glycosyltransferase [Candidatus Promineifilaceae bacterium]|nr:glycosyltransferase [Candidatus Promineifilaceae bacterium]